MVKENNQDPNKGYTLKLNKFADEDFSSHPHSGFKFDDEEDHKALAQALAQASSSTVEKSSKPAKC